MNVFQKTLKQYKEIHIKECIEIKFSHGGHLFAAANTHSINVFNFYTGENRSDKAYQAHKGKVKSISWFEDDFGFVSTSMDGLIYIWDLKNSNNPEYFYKTQKVTFNCVEKSPDMDKKVYAVGTDKTLREISYKPPAGDKGAAGSQMVQQMIQGDKSKEMPATEE